MSMTPTTPSFNLKTFWQRPEGKTGAVVLVATAVAGLYGASLLLPWAIAFVTDALHLMILLGALGAVLYVITNKQFRTALKNLFQMSMRWFTGMVIEIDPIGILENTVDQMEDNKVKLDKAIAGTNGARQQVKEQMDINDQQIRHATSLKTAAENAKSRATDPLQAQRFDLNVKAQLLEIGRREHSNEKLRAIYDQTTKLYTILTKWQNLAEFNIENMKAEVQNAKVERKTILAAYKGMGFAQRLIKGDPEQMRMMNQSLEYLVEDNAQKLGEMEDFARYSEKFLTNMDLENDASASDAEAMLAKYEQKVLTAGGQQPAIPVMRVADAVPVSRSTRGVSGDYLDDVK